MPEPEVQSTMRRPTLRKDEEIIVSQAIQEKNKALVLDAFERAHVRSHWKSKHTGKESNRLR